MRLTHGLILAAALSWSIAGSGDRCPETFVSLDQLVGEYNANAAAVPRLWARARIAVTLADEKGRTFQWGSTSPLASPNGLLLMQKGDDPLGAHDFVLIGREAGSKLFQTGSSTADGVYYLWLRFGDHGGAWWGRQEFAAAPGVDAPPIDPNQILALLGVFELPTDFTHPPTVALAMSSDPCAYVVTYLDRQPITNRLLFRREVYFHWSDSKPRRPYKVNLFAADGRRVMTAYLKNYKSIAAEDADCAAVMPSDIRIEWIRWPGLDSPVRSLRLVISEMTTAPKGDPAAAARFWDNLPGGLDQTQVDSGLTKKGGPE